jgi:hypothetical protein
MNTTNAEAVITTDEKLHKILVILERLEARQERLEARQIKVKEEVDDIQIHEPPIQGSWGTVNTGQRQVPKPVS